MSKAHKKTEAEKITSILVITLGFLGLWFLTKKQHTTLLYISFGVGALSLLSSTIKDGILWVWDKIALVLGWINTRIILALVFFVFLFPMALLTRIRMRNLLQLKKTNTSVYKTRNHTYSAADLENTW